MKKLFVVVLATIAMAACTNDEVVSINESNAIQFGNVIVDKGRPTRAVDPGLNTDNIKGFNVWGFMDTVDTPILNGDEVTKDADGEWTYSNTQYWFLNHKYYFAALAPMKQDGVTNWTVDTSKAGANGLGVVSFENKNGTEDLVYATAVVTTSNNVEDYPGSVTLDFDHLLSKVKFTFKTGFADQNTSVVVSNIKMTVPNKASLDLTGDNAWVLDANATNVTLEFGDVAALSLSNISADCADERLTIPTDDTQEYIVTFDVEIKLSGKSAEVFKKSAKISGIALERGKAYNFITELTPKNMGLYPIIFDVTVKEWPLHTNTEVKLNN